MSTTLLPTVKRIRKVFARAVADLGGTVADSYDDGRCLFLRSLLPLDGEVRPQDRLQGGVALRVAETDILVHPYVFRQVCRNGAIMAQALETCRIGRVESYMGRDGEEAVLAEVSAAVHTCAGQEAFHGALEPMRLAATQEADIVLTLMPMLSQLPRETAAQLLGDIMGRYHAGRDSSRFGLMNAVTSLARDTRDPELRWHLEELGGGIPALVAPTRKPDSGVAMAMRA
jgi:hypothetical protein